jgi:signal transduction histidine kinase
VFCCYRGVPLSAVPDSLDQIAQEINMTLEARVGEMTRIARELHDTLLRGFHGLLLRFQCVDNLPPERPAEGKKGLAAAIDQAAQAIIEGRDAVQRLRFSTAESNDLAGAVSRLSTELAADETNSNRAAFHVVVEGRTRDLQPILRDEVYRMAGEALRNAFRHAQARRIEVEIRYDNRQFRLRVRDDGRGIGPKVLSQDERAGHYGLHGMRERAKLVGGKLDVWSGLESGTEIELTIPSSIAYATSPGTRLSWLSQKLSEKLSRKETQMKS